MSSVNFEKYQGEANAFLYEIMAELRVDNKEQAGRITRAVFHALRDRMQVEEAANFASQLPLMWKGIFWDDFTPSRMPARIRHGEDWIEYIRQNDAMAIPFDFPTPEHVISAFNCVLRALQRLTSPELIEKVLLNLPHEIKDMVDIPALTTNEW